MPTRRRRREGEKESHPVNIADIIDLATEIVRGCGTAATLVLAILTVRRARRYRRR